MIVATTLTNTLSGLGSLNVARLELTSLVLNTQEEILGFSTTQIHYVFSEMGQSSVLYVIYMVLVKNDEMIRTFIVKCFKIVLDSDMLHYVFCN
jgi:hypothetical protein